MFDKGDIKPLAVGIDAMPLADANRRGLDLELGELNRFLVYWTRYNRYAKAMAKGAV